MQKNEYLKQIESSIIDSKVISLTEKKYNVK